MSETSDEWDKKKKKSASESQEVNYQLVSSSTTRQQRYFAGVQGLFCKFNPAKRRIKKSVWGGGGCNNYLREL